MSDLIRRMLADRARGARAFLLGRRRELLRQVVKPRRTAFAAGFRIGAAFWAGKPLAAHEAALAEGFVKAQDPEWGVDRAWMSSLARRAALAEVQRLEEQP